MLFAELRRFRLVWRVYEKRSTFARTISVAFSQWQSSGRPSTSRNFLPNGVLAIKDFRGLLKDSAYTPDVVCVQ